MRCARSRSSATALGIATLGAAAQQPGEIGWPRQLKTDSAKIIIYQPEPESLKGINLTARSAVSVTRKGSTTPVFGVVWFSARAQTDKDSRTVHIDQVVVANVRFTGITPEKEKSFRAIVGPLIESWRFEIAFDRFSSSLELAAVEERSADSLNTTPPVILTSNVPAALLLYAGEPILQRCRTHRFKRAVNTPMMVVWDSAAAAFYLNGGPLWYGAKSALGPWEKITAPPAPVKALVPDSLQRDSAPPGAPPKIVVATKPTELIVFEGAPSWSPMTGTDLLYVKNTDRVVFKDLGTQLTYVLLSGRWFSAKTFDGPWKFVNPDSLPKSFAKIPPASAKVGGAGLGAGHAAGEGRGHGRADPADRGDRPRDGEGDGRVRWRAEILSRDRHRHPVRDQYRVAGAEDRLDVLRVRQGGVVPVGRAAGSVDSGRLRAAGGAIDPAELAGLQREVSSRCTTRRRPWYTSDIRRATRGCIRTMAPSCTALDSTIRRM